MMEHYEITLDTENFYEAILWNYLEHHKIQEVINTLLIEALYEEKSLWIPKQIEKGELK